jgi:hypothetical protein
MRLPGPWKPEGEDVDGLVEEAPGRELLERLLELDRKTDLVERVPRLARRELRSSPRNRTSASYASLNTGVGNSSSR